MENGLQEMKMMVLLNTRSVPLVKMVWQVPIHFGFDCVDLGELQIIIIRHDNSEWFLVAKVWMFPMERAECKHSIIDYFEGNKTDVFGVHLIWGRSCT